MQLYSRLGIAVNDGRGEISRLVYGSLIRGNNFMALYKCTTTPRIESDSTPCNFDMYRSGHPMVTLLFSRMISEVGKQSETASGNEDQRLGLAGVVISKLPRESEFPRGLLIRYP